MKLLFLCRGSARDGLGHVTRSKAVAEQASGDAEVCFVVIGDPYVENLLLPSDLSYEVVPDEDGALSLVRAADPDVVIFDLVEFDRGSLREIAAEAVTVSLSPIFNALADVDLVFHRTAVTGPDWPTGSRVRRGLRYAVIREHCSRIPEAAMCQSLAADQLAVAISMGGTDAANKTLQVLEVLKEVDERLLIWVMLGEGYAHSYEELVRCIRDSRHEIVLAKTSYSMWRILAACSLVILAGGTTTYEAARAGLPSINTLESPGHYYLIEELVERGVCLCAGRTFAESLAALGGLTQELLADRDRLLAMHRRSRDLLDGRGALRILREILAFCREHRQRGCRLETGFTR